MPGDFEELRKRVTAAARQPGRSATALAGVAVIRWDVPIARKSGWSPSLSLGVIIQGKKRVSFGARHYVYHPGRYLVVTGERVFETSVEQASAVRPYLSLSVLVDPALVARLLMALSDSALPQPAPRSARQPAAAPEAFVSRLDPALTDALVRLMRVLDDPAECHIVGPLVIEEIVFRLLRSEAASVLRELASRGDDQRRVHTAMAFIRDHATERLSVEQIARHVAMSPSHFAHRFRDIARVSPIQYVKHVRLERARLLMLHHGARAAEAATAVGYASASHFTRDFRRQFDGPPAQYIERLRAEVTRGAPMRVAPAATG
jgi:AraC-like DNA-binding protein